MESFNEIPDSNNWKIIKLIHKGWSDDKKYYIKTVEEKELLLRISDITQYENKKKEWKGEAIFLRAFFHFQLLRIYGPMNVYENALKPNEDFTSILSQRIPLEKCTDFIINECDRAAEMLPIKIDPVKFNQYAGHATKAASMALKARVLLYLASPLWNGNPDYANFTNKEGENLFPKEYDENNANNNKTVPLFDFRKK